MMGTTASALRTLVIGAGSWGTALAATATQNSQTLLWCRHEDQAQTIRTQHYNPRYLSDYPLPKSLSATSSSQEALAHLQSLPERALIILGTPVKAMRTCISSWFPLLEQAGLNHIPVVWTCKGFEQTTGLLPHEIMQQVANFPHIGVLSGPSFAQEVIQGLPVALTIASDSYITQQRTTEILHNTFCRIYQSSDVNGVEVGGALKNVIAIACGIADGLALGNNARAALITRGLAEISRLGIAMQGQAETFAGLTGLGDLVLTSTSDLSRNRQVGLALARGTTLANILSTGITAEGVRSAQDILKRAKALSIDMPITETICQVLFENLPPKEAVQQLLTRAAKQEYL